MTHDLVIFDCDGVLVDSEVISNQCMIENLARHGLDLTLAEAMTHFVGGSMQDVQAKAMAMGATLGPGWVDDMYAETYARLRQGVPLVDGIPALLSRLDKVGLPYCVASNGSLEKMQITLGQNGLWERFADRRFSAKDLGRSKPDPALFLYAAQQMGAHNPVVIEDSASGAEAAQRAGMRCLGFAPGSDGAGLSAFGAEIFGNMSEVPARLGL